MIQDLYLTVILSEAKDPGSAHTGSFDYAQDDRYLSIGE